MSASRRTDSARTDFSRRQFLALRAIIREQFVYWRVDRQNIPISLTMPESTISLIYPRAKHFPVAKVALSYVGVRPSG